jgi:hypothetical protein
MEMIKQMQEKKYQDKDNENLWKYVSFMNYHENTDVTLSETDK